MCLRAVLVLAAAVLLVNVSRWFVHGVPVESPLSVTSTTRSTLSSPGDYVSAVFGHQAALIQCAAVAAGPWMAVVGGWPWSADDYATDNSSSVGGVWRRDQYLWDVAQWQWVNESAVAAAAGTDVAQWLFPAMPQPAALLATVHHRQYHTLTPFGDGMFALVGGYRGGLYLNDVFVLVASCDSAAGALNWYPAMYNNFTASADCPLANGTSCVATRDFIGRAGHSASSVTVSAAGPMIVVAGGEGVAAGGGSQYFSDVWLLRVTGNATAGQYEARWWRSNVALFGSTDNDNGRAYHTATTVDAVDIAFWGGKVNTATTTMDVNEVWWLRADTMEWTVDITVPPSDAQQWCGKGLWGHQAQYVKQAGLAVTGIVRRGDSASGTSPGADQGSSLIQSGSGWIVVVGGYCDVPQTSDGSVLNSVGTYNRYQLVYDLLDHSWTAIDDSGANYGAVGVHASSLMAANLGTSDSTGLDVILVFGGDSDNQDPTGQVRVLPLNSVYAGRAAADGSLVAEPKVVIVNGTELYPSTISPSYAAALISGITVSHMASETVTASLEQSANVAANVTSMVQLTGMNLVTPQNSMEGFIHITLSALGGPASLKGPSADCYVVTAGNISDANALKCATAFQPSGYFAVHMAVDVPQDDGSLQTVLWADAVGYACDDQRFTEKAVSISNFASTLECIPVFPKWQLESQTASSIALGLTFSHPNCYHLQVEFRPDLPDMPLSTNCRLLNSGEIITGAECSLPDYSSTDEPVTVTPNVHAALSGTRWVDQSTWYANVALDTDASSSTEFLLGGVARLDWMQLIQVGGAGAFGVLLGGAGLHWNESRWTYAVSMEWQAVYGNAAISTINCTIATREVTTLYSVCHVNSTLPMIGVPFNLTVTVMPVGHHVDGPLQPMSVRLNGTVCTWNVLYMASPEALQFGVGQEKTGSLVPQVIDFSSSCSWSPPVTSTAAFVTTTFVASTVATLPATATFSSRHSGSTAQSWATSSTAAIISTSRAANVSTTMSRTSTSTSVSMTAGASIPTTTATRYPSSLILQPTKTTHGSATLTSIAPTSRAGEGYGGQAETDGGNPSALSTKTLAILGGIILFFALWTLVIVIRQRQNTGTKKYASYPEKQVAIL